MERHHFNVDLGGLVELLSRNLYSGPRVFVRELLQNGIDATTARRAVEPGCPARIAVDIDGPRLRMTDSGKGLTLDEASSLLATIGASSKRDDFGFQREEYLGQFGIGLLSALMVSPTIVVYSRSIDALDAPIRWEGSADGRWQVRLASQEEIPSCLAGVGTTVELQQQDFDFSRVPELVRYYGSLLDVEIVINGEPLPQLTPPWLSARSQREQWCHDTFGFEPFDSIELHDPVAGAQGVAFVMPHGAHPGHHVRHTVYMRSMLLSDTVLDIVPEWAYFVRVVVDVTNLRPTASREALVDDDLLADTRENFGAQIRTWLNDLEKRSPERFADFAKAHFSGLKYLAISDEATRQLVARSVPVPTTLGPLTYDDIIARYGSVSFVRSNRDFETIESLARARDLCVVNAGFAFDEEIIEQLRLDRPHVAITQFVPDTLLGSLDEPTDMEGSVLAEVMGTARGALASQQVSVELKSFEPADIPVVYLPQPAAAGDTIEQQAAELDPLVALMNPPSAPRKPLVVFNARCATVHRLASVQDRDFLVTALRGMYVQALISAHRPLDAEARSWSANLFTSLIHRLS